MSSPIPQNCTWVGGSPADAIDPVQRRASNPFRLSRKVDLSKAGKKGGERAKEKARQKRIAADLAVDFSKPYGKGA